MSAGRSSNTVSMLPPAAGCAISLWVLVPLFIGSGATSLIYEVVWARQLHLVFGTSQLAICTVLAAFMGGLALGGMTAARWAHRTARPLAVYGVLEAGIGIYAVLFPSILKLAQPIYIGLWRLVGPESGPRVFGAFQLVLVGLLLLPPTICMGATLPLLARCASPSGERAGVKVGWLYGSNTLGAVVGTALAGFVLLPWLGLSTTTWSAAAANIVLGLAAVGCAFRGPRLTYSIAPPVAPSQKDTPELMPVLLAVTFISGFCGLLYEVAWFRLMSLVLGGSVYAFTAMLVAFLLGIALGGGAAGPWCERVFARWGRAGVWRRVVVLQISVAMLSWMGMYAYGQLPFVYVWLYGQLEQSKQWLMPASLLLPMAVMLAPVIAMGATFPFLVRGAVDPQVPLSRTVGWLYTANTIGAIIGAAAGGLLLLPTLQVRGAVLLAVMLNLLAAAMAAWWAMMVAGKVRWRRLAGAMLAGAAVVAFMHLRPPPWDPQVMSAGFYKYAIN